MIRRTRVVGLLALLLCGLASISSGETHGHEVKRSMNFVSPADGSAHALVLSTVVTGAADLHYVVLPTGRQVPAARDLKKIAINDVRKDMVVESSIDIDCVIAAGSKAIPHAQKIETWIDDLASNTTYDVFFVVEVPHSNGVFGTVQTVRDVQTSADPPIVAIESASAASDSATMALLNISLSSPGRLHIALVPSTSNIVPAFEKDHLLRKLPPTVEKDGRATVPHVVFHSHSQITWPNDIISLTIEGLLPSTMYDALILTESPSNSNIFSEMHHHQSVFLTHAQPPNVTNASALAVPGRKDALEVLFHLQFDPLEIARVTNDQLALYRYRLEYIAAAQNHTGTTIPSTKETVDNEVPSIARGEVPWGNFSSVEELVAAANMRRHSFIISGLGAGQRYQVHVTALATGDRLQGLQSATVSAMTHDNAPAILGASITATNGSVSSLTVDAQLYRPGNLHYVIVPASYSPLLRRPTKEVDTPQKLQEWLLTQPQVNTADIKVGHVDWNLLNPYHQTNTSYGGSAAMRIWIGNLEEDSAFVLELFAETLHSNGVFGERYVEMLEQRTNAKASDIVLESVVPTPGATDSIHVVIRKEKKTDIVHYCFEKVNGYKRQEVCDEVRELVNIEVGQEQTDKAMQFQVSNLTDNTTYQLYVYTESELRNQVTSDRSELSIVTTHRIAPHMTSVSLAPLPASNDSLQATIRLDDTPCYIHYVVRESIQTNDTLTTFLQAAEVAELTIGKSTHEDVVSTGLVYAQDRDTVVTLGDLQSNTSYEVTLMTESLLSDDRHSQVYGDLMRANASTHANAPSLVLTTMDPLPGTIDSIIIKVNATSPGLIHYFLVDYDYADPSVLKHGVRSHEEPHEVRGTFQVVKSDMVMEIKNGTNETQPMQPLVYATNVTVNGLREGRMYHGSLTTETIGSGGVFGPFPPPVLVTTHIDAPAFIPETLSVLATPASSSSITARFQTNTFGDIHYALFFRGIVPDRHSILQKEEIIKVNEDSNETTTWPPPSSSFDLIHLNGEKLKEAEIETLGVGVWENGTISVSREDVFSNKLITKEIKKLPPNALFDLCFVPETKASGGVLRWRGHENDCHRVKTHADYTNQSMLLDDVRIDPIDGHVGGLRIRLSVSKLLHPEEPSSYADVDRIAALTGRIPFFLLVDGKHGHKEFRQNQFVRNHDGMKAFKEAPVGKDHVVATGSLVTAESENETHVEIVQDVHHLEPNYPYYLFIAHETLGSDGVFTKVNACKTETIDTSERHEHAIEVRTFEKAPKLTQFQATPTYGKTNSITVKLDVSCESCAMAIAHLLVFHEDCPSPALTTKYLSHLSSLEDTASATEACTKPLAYKVVRVEMDERQKSKTDVTQELSMNLQPNTSYKVLLATETAESRGVTSDTFQSVHVRTWAKPPQLEHLQVHPRNGSTTELLIQIALDHPGEVHFLCGKSDNPELVVSSPLNISDKRLPDEPSHGRGSHDYPHDVVRLRRSLKLDTANVLRYERIPYLDPATEYDVYIVVESNDNNGVYGDIYTFKNVSTFTHAPLLLGHTAYPTPGITSSITVGYRVSTAGMVHISLVSTHRWKEVSTVVGDTTEYSNKLAVKESLEYHHSIRVSSDEIAPSPTGSEDSGWRELNFSVAQAHHNYTVYLTTETMDSEGIYGAVAMHQDVRAHSQAPEPIATRLKASDARIDSLTARVELSDVGHVHYAAFKHGAYQENLANAVAKGVQTVHAITNGKPTVSTDFVIDGLAPGTRYDVYFRCESLDSHGVFGTWTTQAVSAETHRVPPEVLDTIQCDVRPSCKDIGREECYEMANVCGVCLDGYSGTSGSSNEPCSAVSNLSQAPARRHTLMISSIRVNKPSQPIENKHSHTSQEEVSSLMEKTVEIEQQKWHSRGCPPHARIVPPGLCECMSGYELDANLGSCVVNESSLTKIASAPSASRNADESYG